MRSFRTAAVLTTIVGLLLGILLGMSSGSADDEGSVAFAAESSPASGLLQGLVQMVGRPLMRALNPSVGQVIKPGAERVDQKTQDKSTKPDKGTTSSPKR